MYFYFVPIFRSEIESNPINRSYIVSSAKIMVTALKRAQNRFKKWDFSLYFYSVLHIFRSEIESNPISWSDVVSSTKNMVTALGRAQKRSKMCFFTLFLQCYFILYIFSDLKLNQTLYLGLILLPPQTLWRLHLKEPKKISTM